jgi:hypothetical protein
MWNEQRGNLGCMIFAMRDLGKYEVNEEEIGAAGGY